jgi:hypothetical protein
MKMIVDLVLDPELPEGLYLPLFDVLTVAGEARRQRLFAVVDAMASRSPPLTQERAADILMTLRYENSILQAHAVLADEAPADTVKVSLGWTTPMMPSQREQEAKNRWIRDQMDKMCSPPMTLSSPQQNLLEKARQAGMSTEEIRKYLRPTF